MDTRKLPKIQREIDQLKKKVSISELYDVTCVQFRMYEFNLAQTKGSYKRNFVGLDADGAFYFWALSRLLTGSPSWHKKQIEEQYVT